MMIQKLIKTNAQCSDIRTFSPMLIFAPKVNIWPWIFTLKRIKFEFSRQILQFRFINFGTKIQALFASTWIFMVIILGSGAKIKFGEKVRISEHCAVQRPAHITDANAGYKSPWLNRVSPHFTTFNQNVSSSCHFGHFFESRGWIWFDGCWSCQSHRACHWIS